MLCLEINEKYFMHCENKKIVSQLIRFQAICQKELGDRKRFLQILENSVKKASDYFKNATYRLLNYEKNNILIYFSVNYLQTLPKTEKDEFAVISGIIFEWCIQNLDYIQKKILDKATPKKYNKIIMAIYSFSSILKKTK